MRNFLIILASVLNLVLADAVTKELAVGLLKKSSAISVIPGFFNLAYVENRGCAWGMFQGQVWPLAAFAILVFCFLVWKRRQVFGSSKLSLVTEILLYAGMFGNLIDRVYRGYVVDMFDFHWGVHHFPCFNLADTYITFAAGFLLVMSFREKKDAPASC